MTSLRELTLAGIGRPEHRVGPGDNIAASFLAGKRIMLTGAAGSIGKPLTEAMRKLGLNVLPTDSDPAGGPWGCELLDITRFDDVLHQVNFHEPDLIINLAAAKLAPQGEVNPWTTLNTSVNGLKNLLDTGRRVLQVSTCKAADPEVAYGSGKLAAEKLAVAYGCSIVRLYNVPEAGPSMLTIWEGLAESEPLPVVAECSRYYLTLREAVSSVLWAAVLPAARYAADPGDPVRTDHYAARAFPDRDLLLIKPRRGDRLAEPKHARCESAVPVPDTPNLNRIISVHDPLVRHEARESQ